MNKKDYDIIFSGLKLGEHQFNYKIDETFFNEYLEDKITLANVNADLLLTKKENMLELDIAAHGTMTFPCDRCLENTNIKVKVERTKIYMNFGAAPQELSEDLIVIKNEDYKVNVADLLYELITVSLPMQKVHHNINDCNRKVIEHINGNFDEYSEAQEHEEEHQKTDPRWDVLNKLKTNN